MKWDERKGRRAVAEVGLTVGICVIEDFESNGQEIVSNL